MQQMVINCLSQHPPFFYYLTISNSSFLRQVEYIEYTLEIIKKKIFEILQFYPQIILFRDLLGSYVDTRPKF